jgi:hypothetical protein
VDDKVYELIKLALVAIPGALAAYYAYRSSKKSDVIQGDVKRIEVQTNSNTEMLAKASRIAGHGEGKEEERAEETARKALRAAGAAAITGIIVSPSPSGPPPPAVSGAAPEIQASLDKVQAALKLATEQKLSAAQIAAMEGLVKDLSQLLGKITKPT